MVGQKSGWTLELLRKLQWVGMGGGVSMGDKEDDAQDSSPLWLAQMDGWMVVSGAEMGTTGDDLARAGRSGSS